MYPIIAIVGMCGSGKSLASSMLEEKGFKTIYFGGVTMEKLKEQNLEVTPENERMVREKLRSDLGMGAFARILLPKITEYASIGPVALDGLYSWDEYKILKDALGESLVMIAIIADKSIRYDRLSKRSVRSLEKEQAESRDIAEIENSAKGGPIAFADYYIFNNYGIEEYQEQLNEILKQVRGEVK